MCNVYLDQRIKLCQAVCILSSDNQCMILCTERHSYIPVYYLVELQYQNVYTFSLHILASDQKSKPTCCEKPCFISDYIHAALARLTIKLATYHLKRQPEYIQCNFQLVTQSFIYSEQFEYFQRL